jgi:hypothetical protein
MGPFILLYEGIRTTPYILRDWGLLRSLTGPSLSGRACPAEPVRPSLSDSFPGALDTARGKTTSLKAVPPNMRICGWPLLHTC